MDFSAVQKEVLGIWYVLYCPNQKEEELLKACRRHLTREALGDVFVFTYDRMRRFHGVWHLERRPLFPHYLFLESENEERLKEELERYAQVFSVFENDGRLVRVEPEEEKVLRMLCGAGHHSQMSRGYIRDGKTVVTEGPLKGKENLIRRIDRHKRIARVGMPSTGQLREMQVGLEIVAKS
ncbi:MAG: antiterminator LoaP [Lachnospiraceae bacterium]|nr:antiterminator LoaP [Lachnospiraceae bacterium]